MAHSASPSALSAVRTGTTRLLRVRQWELWSLPAAARSWIAAAVLAWLAAMALTAHRMAGGQHLVLFAVLVACGAISIEGARRVGEPAGVASTDLLGAWYVPAMLLLPPVFSLLLPVPFLALTQFRIRRTASYRRVYSAATIGLAYAAASLLFHAATPHGNQVAAGARVLIWAGLGLIAVLLALFLIRALLAVAVHLTDPQVTIAEVVLSRDNTMLDVCEQCTGVMVALVCALNPLLGLICLVPALYLERGLMHDQLTAVARLDPRTGLLNAPNWEREAASELARGVRTGTPVSVLLIDVDHFKAVNDTWGHLAGDEVLCGVAEIMRHQTREYDQCARFGGDEFAVLLPQADVAEALRTAERIRRQVEALRIPAGDDLVSVTVSIGVAQSGEGALGVTDLLAAADASLYRAKADGRARVRSTHDL